VQSVQPEFQEVGHSGGKVIFHVVTREDGRRSYQITWQSDRPVPTALFAIYALPQGLPVAPLPLGGIGQPWPAPPFPGCVPVFIASDSEGMFGHQCPACDGYWRSRGPSLTCPYCNIHAGQHDFLTTAQRSYVQQYCDMLNDALADEKDGDHIIDMDAVADAVRATEKPAFYYTEESQQHHLACRHCGSVTDILGKFGYCSVCGTRNDLQELEEKTIPELRARINGGGPYEACVKDAVAAFDSLAGLYVRQLVQRVPMTPSRKGRIAKMRFHNLQVVAAELKSTFDIDILGGMRAEEIEFATLLFHRRHVYEHKGGEADEKYIADSGDVSVRPKQALHETQQSAHQLATLIVKLATNLHRGFHDIFPPDQGPIKTHAKRNARS